MARKRIVAIHNAQRHLCRNHSRSRSPPRSKTKTKTKSKKEAKMIKGKRHEKKVKKKLTSVCFMYVRVAENAEL